MTEECRGCGNDDNPVWRRRPFAPAQGTVTGAMATVPWVGSSSVSCETPGGVITSTAFGTKAGSNPQTGWGPPGAQTPNRNDS